MIITLKVIPFRIIFTCRLWIHQGEPLGKGLLQDPTQIKKNTRKFLAAEVKKLPPRPFRTLKLKTILEPLQPTRLVVRSCMESETVKCTPIRHDIISDPRTAAMIEITDLVWDRLNTMELGLGRQSTLGKPINSSYPVFKVTPFCAMPKVGVL